MSVLFYFLIIIVVIFFGGKFKETPSSKIFSSQREEEFDYEAFKQTLLVLTAVVMKADGHTTKAELSAFKNFWNRNYGEADTAKRLKHLKWLLEQNLSYRDACLNLTRNVNYSVRLEVLRYLFIVGSSDSLLENETRILQDMAHYMNIQRADYNSILALYYHTSYGGQQYRSNEQQYQQSSQQSSYSYSSGNYQYQSSGHYNNWAYTALEIEPTATDDEVKKAYRRMALKYHPDKISGLGEAAKRAATEKFQALAEAYESIKRERGIK
ncbi:MAG: DnaJ domain-containing protein [Paludibacteraceae bacterium]|nr:DnaJ domain-containing protein [Paludibacteraceae bacterium]